MPRSVPVEDRFWKRVRKDPDGCWRWTGALFAGSGYGMLSVNRRPALAHRVSWELHRGAIPEGAHLDHLCRVRECVNPEHLEPVSPRENLMRGETTVAAQNAAKIACPLGHPYDETNTYVTPDGKRGCRECRRRQWREWNRRRQAAVAGARRA